MHQNITKTAMVSLLAPFWHAFGLNFRYFFGIDFCMPFLMPFFDFWSKMAPKRDPKIVKKEPKWRLKSIPNIIKKIQKTRGVKKGVAHLFPGFSGVPFWSRFRPKIEKRHQKWHAKIDAEKVSKIKAKSMPK